MKSMTGHGRGDCTRSGTRIVVEVSSVNRRQTEVVVALPRELESVEGQVREVVNARVARGRLTVRVGMQVGPRSNLGLLQVNRPLARAYVRELRDLAGELGLNGALTVEVLARVPGIFQTGDEVSAGDRLWPAVQAALERALAQLVRMRQREGSHLARELRTRMKAVQQSVARVRRRAPQVVERYRDQLRERVRSAGIEWPAPEDDRLLKEIVYFADRSDITEELARLESHFSQFADCLASAEPVGRTLDFLAQEMHREVNTLGSKANDSQISREVVLLKAELEKFREQVQNVE
jgi:uncharacterized protein (TIGR00255 family)